MTKFKDSWQPLSQTSLCPFFSRIFSHLWFVHWLDGPDWRPLMPCRCCSFAKEPITCNWDEFKQAFDNVQSLTEATNCLIIGYKQHKRQAEFVKKHWGLKLFDFIPALEGEDESEEDDDEHENPCNHSRHFHSAVHLLLRLHGIRILRGCTYTYRRTDRHTQL